ncbi:hypothetical protein HWV62_26052 [Athelia sp. TMB]|nr:hypothetical protein HWV62_26052 [Athelia sp. TMB]
MTHKRPFAAFNSPESSSPPQHDAPHDAPHPKRRLVSISAGPFAFSSPSTIASTSTTPYSARAYYHVPPSDSPSNPFGRIRKRDLTLPRPTSFSKHLPLRLQVVHISGKGAGRAGEAHRIVQVPLNYTFRHLKKLLDFLFTPDTSEKALRRQAERALATPPASPSSAASGLPSPTSPPSPKLAASPRKPKLEYSPQKVKLEYSPKKMKLERRSPKSEAALPCASLSKPKPASTAWPPSTRLLAPPKPSTHLFEVQSSLATFKGSSFLVKPGHIRTAHTWAKLSPLHNPCSGLVEEGDGDEEWEWKAEEDFTLGHVWPEGGDLKRGITYHHSPTLQIHITINTSKIPARKGVGNKPFVFSAVGAGFVTPDAEEWDFDAEDEDVEAQRWNAHNAFDQYLVREAARGPPPLQDTDDEEEEEAGEGCDPDKSDLMLIPSLMADSTSSSPFGLPTTTPAPVTRLHRLRVEYASRRLVRLNRKGIEELVSEVGDGEEAEGEDELKEDGDGEQRLGSVEI